MRTQKSLKNLIISVIAQVVTILLSFFIRTIFIRQLSADYLGINGLFSNILKLLSFSELGFAAAITSSLYKPLAERDEETIAGIMHFFSKVYNCIGAFVLVVGLILTPFIDRFISEIPPNMPNIYLIYVLWVVNSGISYFVVYKSTLIIANQEKYIVDLNNLLFKIIVAFAQCVILLVSKNYILYLWIQLIGTIVNNISINIIANNKYTLFSHYRNIKIRKELLFEIRRNVRASICYKFGDVVINGTDNILLSKFFGLTIVGLYSNYLLIIDTVSMLVGQIQSSIVASIGNLGVGESFEKKTEVYERYLFINFIVYTVTSTSIFSLINIFISIWLGKNYTLTFGTVCILILNYFIRGYRSATDIFITGFGLYWRNKYIPIIESILNVLLSILFSFMFGYIGVFVGTLLSSVATGLWFNGLILYKYGLNDDIRKYYIRTLEYILVMLFDTAITGYIIHCFEINNIIEFIFSAVISLIISISFLLLLYCRSKRMRDLMNFCKVLISIVLRKE